jgi:hypothetical protein
MAHRCVRDAALFWSLTAHIQLSYGRLSASIDETPVSRTGPDFARFGCGGGSCGKVRTFESSRARQLPCAEGVPGLNSGSAIVSHSLLTRI